jgi:transposase
MLGRHRSAPALFQYVNVEELVPKNHFLRKVDAVLDLSFVREAVAECYSASRGRPSVDPELALKMMLLGHLYDIGDRELCDEIGMHVGMRWFLGLNLHDPVPDHSTLSKLKNERWAQSGLFQRLFDKVVLQCSEAGLVSGRHLSGDGTQMRADASMQSLEPIIEAAAPSGDAEDPSGEPGGSTAQEQPAPTLEVVSGEAKEPQPRGGWKGHGVKYSNQTHRSTSDPDARLYRKGKGKESKLSYLVHDLIDTKSRVILSRKVSEAHSSAERRVCIEMLDEVLAKQDVLGLPNRPEVISLDGGYGTGEMAAALLDRGVLPHMPLQAGPEMEAVPEWKRPTYDLPQRRAREEKVRQAQARNRVRELQKTRGYQVSRRLRPRSEHTFAEAKTQHGMDRARVRGEARVGRQALLTGAVQNLKRLAAFRGRRRPAGAQAVRSGPSGGDSRHNGARIRLRTPAPHAHRLTRGRFGGPIRSQWRNWTRAGGMCLGLSTSAGLTISSTAF